MFFRFGSAVVLVVVISLCGVALEKSNLTYRSSLTRQHYQLDALREQHARLRARTQSLGAPSRMIDAIEDGRLELTQPEKSAKSVSRRRTLLRWRRNLPQPE